MTPGGIRNTPGGISDTPLFFGGYPVPPWIFFWLLRQGEVRQVCLLPSPTGSGRFRRAATPEILDGEALEALADKTAGTILKEGASLPEREKGIVLGIVRQCSEQLGAAGR